MENTVDASNSSSFTCHFEKNDNKDETNGKVMEHSYMLSKQSLGEFNFKHQFKMFFNILKNPFIKFSKIESK
jgi:hypothetical protein